MNRRPLAPKASALPNCATPRTVTTRQDGNTSTLSRQARLLSLRPTGTRGCSSMAEPQPSKLVMRVRFPSSAPVHRHFSLLISIDCAELRAFRARSQAGCTSPACDAPRMRPVSRVPVGRVPHGRFSCLFLELSGSSACFSGAFRTSRTNVPSAFAMAWSRSRVACW